MRMRIGVFYWTRVTILVVPVFVLLAKAFVGDLHFCYYISPTMSDSELACVYSALILHDAGVQVTVSSLITLPFQFPVMSSCLM